RRPSQRDKAVRRSEIAIELGNLVLEDEMIPKSIPGQIRQQAVILVPVVSRVRQDQVGIHLTLELFERVLDVAAVAGKKAVSKTVHRDALTDGATEEQRGARSPPARPGRCRGEPPP